MTQKNMLWLPDALRAAGVNVRTLDGWEEPHSNGSYIYREAYSNKNRPSDKQVPFGHVHHHTATSSYVPNRVKAQGYAGLSHEGSERLYQEAYDDDGWEPIYVVANAYPAPISTGYGVREVLTDFVMEDIPFSTERQTQPDTPKYAGNTRFWNTEWILDGVGAIIDKRVWDMMVTVNAVMNHHLDWTPARHIAHGYWTGRKVDLRDGRWMSFNKTLKLLRAEMRVDANCPWTSNTNSPQCDRHYFPPSDLPKGNGMGENQGSCDVPDQQQPSVAWAFSEVDNKRYKLGNGYRYAYPTILTEGRENAMEYRDAGSPVVPI